MAPLLLLLAATNALKNRSATLAMAAALQVTLDETMTSLVDPLVAARARDGVVVPLFSNLGFVPFLKNLLCSMDRVRVSNWVVIALDNSTCAPIRGGFGLAYASPACVFPYAHRPLTTQGAASYRTAKIIRMVIR
ncbi:hypothetical protein EMIHUDRAFT_204922 [Emiliania huxleyi CCMP1516]|uniref:Secreted protein n=2 Tax=Emiliania huxleyi TaxID=2903 RepID=A0A0D3JWK8_EMIH1|nr:hypothetical protein EMIHUDRAFT_204922 [Emiliania huxleyi CCMP1516]EOD27893.1 hypothetical protein EMIHUDRAFT_204922 [Emiliania huxleyi CCMP1516]|eukprot:XP_005780322.1 hypothetical protein EMIHUDRAFT_204922 [Emiliania huxleyi CCMP1516]